MAVTLRDVAKRAGVSAMTVSRVVNGGAGVDPETQRRVEEAILALDYVPNRLARGLVSHKTKTIGLIVPDVVNPFFAPVVRGAESTARKAGYRVLLCNSEGDLRLEREYIEDLVAHRVEGLLIAPASDRSRVGLLPLLKSGFPDRAARPLAAGHRLRSGGQRQRRRRAPAGRASDRASDIGASRISPNRTTSRPAATGSKAIARRSRRRGIPYSEELVFRTTVDRIGGYRAAQQMLALDPLPTAIFTVNNMTAVGAMQALRERGLVGAEGHRPRLLSTMSSTWPCCRPS